MFDTPSTLLYHLFMNDQTPRHPIRVVAQRTGLTPATLRAWERRYDVVHPGRSEGGQRLYSDHDVERLSHLRELTEVGRPISMVAALPLDHIQELLDEDRAAVATQAARVATSLPAEEAWVDAAFKNMIALDSDGLESVLRRAALSVGATPFMDDVATPLLHRVGSAWYEGNLSPAQEHLGSAVLERVLHWLTGPLADSSNGPSIVVATLPGEQHGLGARLVTSTAELEGWNVTFLGTDLPVADIASAAEEVGASAVALSIVIGQNMEEIGRSLILLRELLESGIAILIGGGASRMIETVPPGVSRVGDLATLREELKRLS